MVRLYKDLLEERTG
jgi:transposase